MTSRPWLLVAGLLTIVGLAVVSWQDPNSFIYSLSNKLIRTDISQLASASDAIEPGSLIQTSRLDSVGDAQQSRTVRPMKNPLSSLKRDEFASISARPLFAPTRRPPQKKRVVRKAPVRKPKPVRVKPKMPLSVVGAVTHTSKRIVIFKDRRTGQHISASTDAKIRDWRVVDIQPSSVLLSKDGWEVRLDIFAR